MLVTATAGEAGLSSDGMRQGRELGDRRRAELEGSARALGCARWEVLGYADSGSGSRTDPLPTTEARDGFAWLDPEEPARRLADILLEESADVLTVYDAHGGYGHPDHVQVHRVGHLAARLAGTRVVLEASVDRSLLQRVARVMRRVPGVARLVPADGFAKAYLSPGELTHRVDVRPVLEAKRAALAAHASQATGGRSVRTVALLLRLPGPVLALVLGHEWFREEGRPSGPPLVDDVFATLRRAADATPGPDPRVEHP